LGVTASSRNFYLDVDDGNFGVWQILPKEVRANTDQEFERALSEAKNPIIVYNHGNCWSRCAPHRTKLYNRLSESGYHVIAFDYRGYGDSPGFPTEDGMIKDAITAYEWALKRAGSNPVLIWGHSLGTAISTAVVDELCAKGECPLGVILESPFNNLKEAVRNHFLSASFRWMPWMDSFLVDPPIAYGLRLDTDERIKRVACPVLIMHDKDDLIVPFHLGQKLHNVAKEAGVDVSLVSFEKFGHKYICNAPQLMDLLKDFIETSMKKRADRLSARDEKILGNLEEEKKPGTDEESKPIVLTPTD